jgi:hypothetical protein
VVRLSYALQDGWSFAVLQEEWFTLYEAFRAGREAALPPPVPLERHLRWVAGRDRTAAARHWKPVLDALAGAAGLADLPDPATVHPGPGELRYDAQSFWLDAAVEQRLRAFGRRHRLTVFTLLHGAWAVTVARATGRDRVAFGTVVSGRSPEVPGYERLAGAVNNILPVVAEVPAGPGVEWLHRVQYAHAQTRLHDWTSLAELRGWAGRPDHDPLVDHVLVYENFPRRAWVDRDFHADWGPDGGETQTEHLLRLLIWPGTRTSVVASYFPDRIGHRAVADLLSQYQTTLETLLEGTVR